MIPIHPTRIGSADPQGITRRQTLKGALIGLLSLTTVTGCHNERPPSPVHMVVGVDYSDSCKEMLPAFVKIISALPGQLDPDCDRLTILRLANSVEEIEDGAPPESSDRFKSIIVPWINVPSVRGTMSRLLWQDLANRLSGEKRPFAIAILSDNDNDEGTPASWAAIKDAAARLAGNPNLVYVALLGIRPSNRKAIRHNLAAFGERLHLFDMREMTLEPLVNSLNASRRLVKR